MAIPLLLSLVGGGTSGNAITLGGSAITLGGLAITQGT